MEEKQWLAVTMDTEMSQMSHFQILSFFTILYFLFFVGYFGIHRKFYRYILEHDRLSMSRIVIGHSVGLLLNLGFCYLFTEYVIPHIGTTAAVIWCLVGFTFHFVMFYKMTNHTLSVYSHIQ